MEIKLVNIFLIKKKYSILNNFVLENINYIYNNIDLIYNFLIKNNYMMYSVNFNKKINTKKKFLFNIIKLKKQNFLTKSIISAYLIYFFIIAKIDQKIYFANENIRKKINIVENENLIENLIMSANNLNFKTIDFNRFFSK